MKCMDWVDIDWVVVVIEWFRCCEILLDFYDFGGII